MLHSLWPHVLQHARLFCPPLFPSSCPLNQCYYPTISSSVAPFSFWLRSLVSSGFFPMSQLFTWDSQSIGVSASASVLPMNIQGWFPLGWTGWISLLSKGLSRVFSNTTAQKHQLFGVQLSLKSNSHIHTWLLEKSSPASGAFQMSQFLTSGGQSIGVSASTSVLPMNTQDWSPLGWTGWISLQSKGLSRVFSNTTVQKHQFFSIELSL